MDDYKDKYLYLISCIRFVVLNYNNLNTDELIHFLDKVTFEEKKKDGFIESSKPLREFFNDKYERKRIFDTAFNFGKNKGDKKYLLVGFVFGFSLCLIVITIIFMLK